MIYGVYDDFATMLLHVVQHALGGPSPSPSLSVRTLREEDDFVLVVRDEGGPVPPTELAMAFEPFSVLHQQVVLGARSPGEGLAACRQLLASYHGEITRRAGPSWGGRALCGGR